MRKLLHFTPGQAILLDCLLLFLIASALVKPLYKVKYLDKWYSIESTFISDGRFLADHWPHPKWQPLWYCGTRFDYIYPPALRYGTAVQMKVYPKLSAVRAYHIYCAFFYSLGIAGVYLLVRLGSGSRGGAWLCALATALMSPSFLFLTDVRKDAWLWVPQRLGVLVRYGEGPHMTAVAVLGFALALTFRALAGRRPLAFAGAAVASALVVSNNFYGATALATFFPILVWSYWITHQDNAIWFRAAGIAILAYGLTAFWLSPSYVKITLHNLQYVSQPGNPWSLWILVFTAVLYVLATNRWARGRKERVWTVFVLGCLVFFSLNVLGHFAFNFRVIGEPGRMIPELDLVMIMAVAEGLRRLWVLPRRRVWIGRAAACVIAAGAFSTAAGYVRQAWDIYPRDAEYQRRLEYRMTEWMHRNLPGIRAFATGSVRFWYNCWFDQQQMGGGSEQGLLNPAIIPAEWAIHVNESAGPGVQWMTALGVDAVIVHDAKSQEHYHDIVKPEKFAVLPLIYDSKQGDYVYRVPRRWASLARVVDAARLRSLSPVNEIYPETLQAYLDLVEKGPDETATLQWTGTDSMRIQGRTAPGQWIIAQSSYDGSWHAYENGKRLRTRPDPIGFLAIETAAGDHDIQVVFETPLENRAGQVLTALSLVMVGALLVRGRRGPA